MKNLSKTKYLCVAALCVVASTSAFAAKTSPFTDNVSINLINFPSQTVQVGYHSDNDVNISGPSSASTDNGHYPIQISSQNLGENGFPSMTITMPGLSGEQCEFNFVDGPWTYLAYRTANPPSCAHLSVGPIVDDGQYQYHIDVTYQQ